MSELKLKEIKVGDIFVDKNLGLCVIIGFAVREIILVKVKDVNGEVYVKKTLSDDTIFYRPVNE